MTMSGLADMETTLDFRILHLIATIIDGCAPASGRDRGHPPAETVRVLATLRQFLMSDLRSSWLGFPRPKAPDPPADG